MNDVQVTFSSDLVSSPSSSQSRNLGFTTLMAFLDIWKKVYVQKVKNKTAILYLKCNRKIPKLISISWCVTETKVYSF